MKAQIFTAYLVLINSICLFSMDPYEHLRSNFCTDHIFFFERVFKHHPVDNFLEFGLGEGTLFFLDHCKQVTSVELISDLNRERCLPWFENCTKKYSGRNNWSTKLIECTPSLCSLDVEIRDQTDPQSTKLPFIDDVHALCENILDGKNYELIFVDAGVHFRGEIVKQCFGKAPIIVAHDGNDFCYGYQHVTCPDDYVFIKWRFGCGTLCWISKDKPELIAQMTQEVL